MDKSPAVLLCGNDEETLVLRSKVLELAGIPVTKTRSEADALRLLAGGDVRVVVLCHSLREAQRTVMLKAAGAAEPRARRSRGRGGAAGACGGPVRAGYRAVGAD